MDGDIQSISNDLWRELVSAEDKSRNFVQHTADGGAIECRFVRREDRYFIAYLSSHTGCRQACRFCHLTATGQTMMTPVDLAGFEAQAARVLEYYDQALTAGEPAAERVNFNFMARGEALLNPTVLKDWPLLQARLCAIAAARGLKAIFNLSTILPLESAEADLTAIGGSGVAIYYSLYSLDPSFRRRWLPRAQDPIAGLARLAAWQQATGCDVAMHWALIDGENDGLEKARAIGAAVRAAGLRTKFNLVRYNPYSPSQGRESARVEEYFEVLAAELSSPESRIVPRVGFDVKASCGMFVG